MPRNLCLALAATLLTAAVARADEPTQSGASAGAITVFGEEVDPDGDCDVTEEGGATTITVPPTWHDLTHGEEYDRLNAPRLLDDAEGDFALEVKVAAFKLPKPHDSSGGRFAYIGTGILIWQDEDNYIRFERASVSVNRYVAVERFENGRSVSQKNADIPDSATWLRVTRSGNDFKFVWSKNGKQWNEVQTLEATLAGPLKVGVHAINTTNEPFPATLSNYRLTP